MKHITRLAILGVAISLGIAASGDAKARDGGLAFETLDRNGDGQLSKSELDAHRVARFSEADLDGDGLLSEAELTAQSLERAKKRAGALIKRLDANGDGMLSAEELETAPKARAGKLFERMDADKDGLISKAEFMEMSEKRKKRMSKE